MSHSPREFPELDERRRELKERYTAAKGWWPALHDPVLHLHPEFLEGLLDYSRAITSKNALDPKTRELIWLAIDVSATHMYNPGTRDHIRQALRRGVSVDEIIETLEIVTLVGVHSETEGMAILWDILQEEGMTPEG
jgi:alkylhydroperoxidase/carboxymuconolactone decarboxylase family protein YurZ